MMSGKAGRRNLKIPAEDLICRHLELYGEFIYFDLIFENL